ncbi:MAG: nickel-type superoxide dismutase maturation protease [Acidobacteriota bacterium]
MHDQLRKSTWQERFRYYSGVYYGYPRLRQLKIQGNSMSPTIVDGEIVFYDPGSEVQVGDIVLTPHPYMQSVKIVKRIREIDPDGNVLLVGDNPTESTDSRTFGTVSVESCIGRVVCRLK